LGFKLWGVSPWGVKGTKVGGGEYGSDILLKSRIMAKKLLFSLILGLGGARVAMTNIKGECLKKYKSVCSKNS